MTLTSASVARSLCEQMERVCARRRGAGHPATAEELRLRAHLAVRGAQPSVVAHVLSDPTLPAREARTLLQLALDTFGSGVDSNARLRLVAAHAARPENRDRLDDVLGALPDGQRNRLWEDATTPPVIRTWLARTLPLEYLARSGQPYHHAPDPADALTILRRFAAQDGEPVDGSNAIRGIVNSWTRLGRRIDEGDPDVDPAAFAAALTAAIDLTLDHPGTFSPYLLTPLLHHTGPADRTRLAVRTFERFTTAVPPRMSLAAVVAALPAHLDDAYEQWLGTITDPNVSRYAATRRPATVQERVRVSCRTLLEQRAADTTIAEALLAGVGTSPHLWDLAVSVITNSDITPDELSAALATATNAPAGDTVTVPAAT